MFFILRGCFRRSRLTVENVAPLADMFALNKCSSFFFFFFFFEKVTFLP